MSASAALHDTVFRTYLEILLGLLIVAGTILALLQRVFQIELKEVWKTYCGWLWMGPLAALMIFAGREPFILGVVVVALLALREFGTVSGLGQDRWMTTVVTLGIISTGACAWQNAGL